MRSQIYRFLFADRLIRLLYYLPMERMMDNETFDEVLNGFKEADSIVKRLKTRIAELEEENKNLKSDYDRLDKVASENVRTLDELNAEIIELKEDWSIEIKTCNRYREKCEKMKKLFEEAEELLLMENLSSQHYWSRKEVINRIKEKLDELDLSDLF